MDRAETTNRAPGRRAPLRVRRQTSGDRPKTTPTLAAPCRPDPIFEPGSIEYEIVMLESLLEAAASRCEGLRRESELLELTSDLGPPTLREVRAEQLERSRERLRCAERSERALNRLLVQVVRSAAYPEVVGGP